MALLRYEFDIIGQNRVAAALASNERIFATHASKINRIVGASSRGGARNEAAAADRSAAQSARTRQREIDAISRSQVALSRQRTREETAAAKAARDASRDKQRAIDAQSRSQAALGRQREREERIATTSARNIARERMRFVQATVGRGAGRVINGLSAVGTAGLAMVGVGGAALAANAVQQAMTLDEMSRRLSIQGRDAGTAGSSPDELRRAFTQTGIAAGIAPEKVAEGVSAYVAETGDLGTAMANRDVWAKTAQAFGSNMMDIAQMAAHMRKIGITNVADQQASFAMLGGQGKRGSFELKNMATEFPQVLSQAATLGITGIGGLRDLGGLMQLTQSSTGNASETTTAVSQMFRQLIAKSGDLAAGDAFSSREKVDIFADKGKTKFNNFRDIIGNVIAASRGNIEELNDLLEIRGSKAFNPFTTAFNNARQQALAGGATENVANAKGKEAALALLDKAAVSDMNWDEVQRDARDAMQSMSVQLEILNNKLKDAIASELFPAIGRLIPRLVEMVPTIAAIAKAFIDFASWLASNPLAGIGMAVAASIAYELAKARIGTVFTQIMNAVLRPRGGVSAGGVGGAGGGLGAGAAGAAGGVAAGGFMGRPTGRAMAGAAVTGLALGATVAAGIYAAGVADYQVREGSMAASGDQLNLVREMNTAGDVDSARRAVADQRRKVAELKNVGFFDSLSEGAYHLFSGGDPTQREVELKTQASFLDEMETKLSALENLKSVSDQLAAAGTSQKEAAEILKQAAQRLGLGPNRSDVPSSPIKG